MNMKTTSEKLLALADAGEAGAPSELRLRHAMHHLMPTVYSLRNKGFSMVQITSLFASAGLESNEFKVTTFYQEWHTKKICEAKRRMEEIVEDLAKLFDGSITTMPERPAPTVNPQETGGAWRCLSLKEGIKPLDQRPEVLAKTPEAYEDGLLEHPAIPRLMLSKDERLYGLCLEMQDEHGETRLESVREKGFRIRWKKPVPMTPSSTGKSFVKMDMELFKPDGKI